MAGLVSRGWERGATLQRPRPGLSWLQSGLGKVAEYFHVCAQGLVGCIHGFWPLDQDGSLLSFLPGGESRVGLDPRWREMVSPSGTLDASRRAELGFFVEANCLPLLPPTPGGGEQCLLQASEAVMLQPALGRKPLS